MKNNRIEIHDFYCLNCGQKSMSLPRQRNHLHGKFHRKKLYCPLCKTTVNHIEVRSEDERWEFLEDFKGGVYEQEKIDTLSYVRDSSLREIYIRAQIS